MNRFVIACLGILAFGWVLVVRADDPAKPDDPTKPKDDKSSAVIKDEARENQQVLERRFKDFEQSLLLSLELERLAESRGQLPVHCDAEFQQGLRAGSPRRRARL